MPPAHSPTPPAPRCATAAAAVSPTGSAASFDSAILVEWPMPWPRDATSVPELAALADAVNQRPERWRVQLVARPGSPTTDAGHAVITYRRVPGQPRYRRTATLVGLDRVTEVAVAMVTEPDHFATEQGADFLVCTHGARDTCCGSLGTRLVNELATVAPGADGGPTIWRTSHLGGHRFAPTALSLPDGATWARLDATTARAAIDRSVPVSALRDRYRGRSSIERAEAQVAEALAFQRHGWEWSDYTVSVSYRPLDDPEATEVLLNYRRPDGALGGYSARVVRSGTIATAPCRAATGKPTMDPVLDVEDFVLLDEHQPTAST